MKFEEALQAMREGKRVRQPCRCYIQMDEYPNYKTIINADGDPAAMMPCELMMEDWEIVND